MSAIYGMDRNARGVKMLPSVPDFLKCECEKILEGKRADVALPYEFARTFLHYADRLDDQHVYGLLTAVQELGAKYERLNGEWTELKENGDDVTRRMNCSVWWETLPKSVDERVFENRLSAGSGSFYITTHEEKDLRDVYGTVMLKNRAARKVLEYGGLRENLRRLGEVMEQMREIVRQENSIQETVNILVHFDRFQKRMMRVASHYYLDSDLLRKFEERKISVRVVGQKFKVKE